MNWPCERKMQIKDESRRSVELLEGKNHYLY